jgi:hypothetical protein
VKSNLSKPASLELTWASAAKNFYLVGLISWQNDDFFWHISDIELQLFVSNPAAQDEFKLLQRKRLPSHRSVRIPDITDL